MMGVANLLMFLNNKLLVRFTIYECSHIVGLLGRQTAGIGLRHVVLDESRHFCDIVHARPVVIRIWAPHGGNCVRFAGAIRAVA